MKELVDLCPNGASSAQLDRMRDGFFRDYGNPFTGGKPWPPHVRVLDSMMSALGMLSSCYTYSGPQAFYGPGISYSESHYEHYLRGYLKEGGTKEKFDAMIQAQLAHYRRGAEVLKDVHTDGEGVSYNSLIEPDEVIAS